MFELRCTVRNCQQILQREGNCLRCPDGHSFDRAKGGYWNLTQPQDKKSSNPGDADEAVDARYRWLRRGYANGLIESLKAWAELDVNALPARSRVVDLGCGEGTFGPALYREQHVDFCGIDLSRKAVKYASRGWPQATWVLANADRGLPFTDASVHKVMSLFGRRPASEMKRVLDPNGICLIAVPGEEDLIELREQVQRTGHRRSRWELVVEQMASVGLDCVEQKNWRDSACLDGEAVKDALAMTYRGQRNSEMGRLSNVGALTVTFSADLMLFRHTK